MRPGPSATSWYISDERDLEDKTKQGSRLVCEVVWNAFRLLAVVIAATVFLFSSKKLVFY